MLKDTSASCFRNIICSVKLGHFSTYDTTPLPHQYTFSFRYLVSVNVNLNLVAEIVPLARMVIGVMLNLAIANHVIVMSEEPFQEKILVTHSLDNVTVTRALMVSNVTNVRVAGRDKFPTANNVVNVSIHGTLSFKISSPKLPKFSTKLTTFKKKVLLVLTILNLKKSKNI